MSKVFYFKKLDQLRFIAFFLVFWQHAFSPSFQNITENRLIQEIINSFTITGGVGVHIFFVLSGFLISFLMLQEEKNFGKINISFFYIRRILRIWPVYYIVTLSGIYLLPELFFTFKFHGSEALNLLFLNNFDMLNHSPNVGIAWSVAIEEQFYLVWPLIFSIFKNKKQLTIISSLLFFLSVAFKYSNPEEAYFHTLGNISYLMTGCLGAIFYVHRNEIVLNWSIKLYHLIIAYVFLRTVPIFIPSIAFITELTLHLVYILIILNLVVQPNNLTGNLISSLGQLTYGMYLYHPIIIIFTKMGFDYLSLQYQHKPLVNFIMAIIALGITLLVAYASYHYIEKIILKRKLKFSKIKTRE
jgi:peptidoglycan/LPS O-acetylase OafA/YrhL